MKATPEQVLAGPTLFYDGTCGFCSRSVQVVLRHDRRGRFRFCTLQSELAQTLLGPLGVDPRALDSAVLVYRNRVYLKSDMALRAGRLLGGVFAVAWLGYLVPRVLRHGAYDWIARNRFAWFGHAESCKLPSPEERARMIA
ncbi:MAG: DCC1-like thiol-disulfide oxidoreductase family protein [Bacteroidia bacterium]|nr:DCC1-like thiol-disulfide oxidoreductase family protein [Bacteroidia bacterium]